MTKKKQAKTETEAQAVQAAITEALASSLDYSEKVKSMEAQRQELEAQIASAKSEVLEDIKLIMQRFDIKLEELQEVQV